MALKYIKSCKLIFVCRLTITETTTHSGLNSIININYVEGRDGGTYECRASNPYGVATLNVHLDILGKNFFLNQLLFVYSL